MSACTNCKQPMGCSCQRRVASDGRSVCSTCQAAYEKNLKTLKQSTPGPSPNNVNVFYKAP